MVTENRHNEYMKHCIALAEKALQNGNPPVGSILVYQDSELVYGMEVDYVGGHSSELKVLDTQKVPKWGAKPKIKNGVLKHQCQELSKRYEDSVK